MRFGDLKAELSIDFDLDLDCFRVVDGDRLAGDGVLFVSRSDDFLRGDGVRVACRFLLSEFDADFSCFDLDDEFLSRELERRFSFER